MSDADESDVLAKIDAAIEGWEQHQVHVPDDLLPVMPEINHKTSAAEISEMFNLDISSVQQQMIDAVMRGERLELQPVYRRRSSAVPGRRPDEEMREKMRFVRGEAPQMVILDEAMDFTEAPLFGRQDAGLDDLEPDGPIDLGETLEFETRKVRPEVISAWTGMPVRRRTIRAQLGRTLQACAASVLSRIPGIRS